MYTQGPDGAGIRLPSLRRDLLQQYKSEGRVTDVLAIAKEYLDHAMTTNQTCEVYFLLGQTMENVNDWESALRWYNAAKECGTSLRAYTYFIHNNIGYCLNQLGRYAESETILRLAIRLDHSRANAFKNLGICLEGLGHFPEAARMYVEAVRANAADLRALQHLGELIGRHPRINGQIWDLAEQIARCKEAVAYVAEERKKTLREASAIDRAD